MPPRRAEFPRSLTIGGFMTAAELLQPAEEISGPDGVDYVRLMDEVSREAARRARIVARDKGINVGHFVVRGVAHGWQIVDTFGGAWQTRTTFDSGTTFDSIEDAIQTA